LSLLSVLAAFLRRDFRINISYRASFSLELLSIVFSLALFFYLGRVVDDTELAAGQNLSQGYFGFVVVGLALLWIVEESLTSFSRKINEEQATGTFEALMATPASSSLIVLGSAMYELLRATILALVLIAVAVVVFGLRLELDAASIGVAVMALAGCLGLFASIGVAVAAATVIIKRTTALLGLTVTALALLGGVYFPVEVFPEPLERLANALPFTWGLDVLRASLLGGDVNTAQLAALFGSAALLLPFALVSFSAAVKRARRTGTLAQY
jgi:ABC-2 type transport system permease protein